MLQSYKELIVWQKSMDLVEMTYRLSGELPAEEKFGLVSQVRRAAVSIPSNIAEGQNRKGTTEFVQFLRIAAGSAAELETQLLLIQRIYPHSKIDSAQSCLVEIQKMLAVLMKSLEKRRSLSTRHSPLETRSGFTLIELMVAMGLFVIVIGISSGTFIRSLRTQRQVVALMAANDNASFTLEQMAREIRTGTAFSSSGSVLSFTNDNDETVEYAQVDGGIERNGRRLTSSNVLVPYLFFSLLGAEPGDGLSTRVTIRMGVSARGSLESFVTRLQTVVSSRVLDG